MSDAIGIAGFAVSVIGIPLAYFLAKRGRQRPDLRYAIDFLTLVDPDDNLIKQGLTVAYENHSITAVSRTRVAIWNHSGDSVRGSDVVPLDPLRISVGFGNRVLKATVTYISRRHNQAEISISDSDASSALVSFDFFDASDGAVFEIVHEGAEKPRLEGTIRGAALTDRGELGLDPELLSTLTTGRRVARLRALVSKYAENFFMPVAGIIVASIFFGLLRSPSRHTPTLVDPTGYDLTNLNGQAEFATKVNKVGQNINLLDQTMTITLIVFVAFIALATIVAARQMRKKFPLSIVRERLASPDPIDANPTAELDSATPVK